MWWREASRHGSSQKVQVNMRALHTRWAKRRDMVHLPQFLRGKCNLSRTVSLLSKDRPTGSKKATPISTPVPVTSEEPERSGGDMEADAEEGEEPEGDDD